MSGQQVGYVRVSSVGQNTVRQLDGVSLHKTFEDKVSGKSLDRPQLRACLEFVRGGDTLHIHSMDRLARNLDDLRRIVKDLTGRGVVVRFHKPDLSFNGEESPMSTLLLSMLGAVAEFERSLIHERQLEGIAIAKAAGKYKGRKPELTPEDMPGIRARIAAGETKASIARQLGVSRQTLHAHLKASA